MDGSASGKSDNCKASCHAMVFSWKEKAISAKAQDLTIRIYIALEKNCNSLLDPSFKQCTFVKDIQFNSLSQKPHMLETFESKPLHQLLFSPVSQVMTSQPSVTSSRQLSRHVCVGLQGFSTELTEKLPRLGTGQPNSWLWDGSKKKPGPRKKHIGKMRQLVGHLQKASYFPLPLNKLYIQKVLSKRNAQRKKRTHK